MKQATILLVSGLLVALAVPAAAITVDGTADAGYGPAVTVQTVQTEFGDSNIGVVEWANGSELDQLFGVIEGGTLYLTLTGNLETNFNKLDIFIDSKAGGQNQLRGDNPDVDFNGLNRMGETIPDSTGDGLTFDAGFEADYYITVTNGDVGGGNHDLFANYTEVLTGGGGIGRFLGQGEAVSDGSLVGGDNPDSILVTINNSNTAGVSSGNAASSGAGVLTGVELAIPLSAIGDPGGCVLVTAFINGGGHDFLANQVLGPLTPPQGNLGEPRLVDFSALSGTQNAEVCEAPVPVQQSTWGQVKARY